jgi:hypothetical protein
MFAAKTNRDVAPGSPSAESVLQDAIGTWYPGAISLKGCPPKDRA